MNYENYMKKCIELAKKGEGKVSPNPLVGAVVLDENNKIIAKGYHQKYGKAHAEVNALKKAGEKAKGGTIIVSLEPCCHYGKTPPCTDLIIKHNLKKVVIGLLDPNPKVSGKGVKILQQAGIDVIEGVLENECLKLNEIFIKNQKSKAPFVSIKSACTLDGKIATKTGSSKWITGKESREEVQRLRNKYDSILTGSGTVICDDPSLTCRMNKGKNPIRVVVDSTLKTNPSSKVYFDDGTKVFIAVSEKISKSEYKKYPENVEFIACPLTGAKIDLRFLLEALYKKGICSILVEAGGQLNGALVSEKVVDKAYIFIAPKILGDSDARSFIEGFNINNINECLSLKAVDVKRFGGDLQVKGYFEL